MSREEEAIQEIISRPLTELDLAQMEIGKLRHTLKILKDRNSDLEKQLERIPHLEAHIRSLVDEHQEIRALIREVSALFGRMAG